MMLPWPPPLDPKPYIAVSIFLFHCPSITPNITLTVPQWVPVTLERSPGLKLYDSGKPSWDEDLAANTSSKELLKRFYFGVM